jgi:Ni,Fe-hydrogenase I cytochrome b subunit
MMKITSIHFHLCIVEVEKSICIMVGIVDLTHVTITYIIEVVPISRLFYTYRKKFI